MMEGKKFAGMFSGAAQVLFCQEWTKERKKRMKEQKPNTSENSKTKQTICDAYVTKTFNKSPAETALSSPTYPPEKKAR